MTLKTYIILFFICATTSLGHAQSGLSKSEIKVISRVQKGRILLRWAPDKPAAWKLLNTYGYTIHRTTVSRDGKTLLDGAQKILNPSPITPGQKEDWEAMAKANDNAAIVAQAIFGASFAVTQNGAATNPFERAIKKAEELRQRYSFALLVIDQDFEVAQKAGLGFIDTDVKVNEKYLYHIKSNVPKDMYDIRYGGVFTGLSEYEELPKPVDFSVTFKDKEAILSWNSGILKDYYNNYKIEKSTDGVTYAPLRERPYTITEKPVKDGRTTLTDSIPNLITYHYRIKGISSFGELSPSSKVIQGQGTPTLAVNPYLTTQKINDKSVVLNWEFPVEKNHMIKGFKLLYATSNTGKYTTVISNIPKEQRSITYNNLGSSNYFKIVAIDNYDKERKSFAMLVQPEDAEPPLPPKGLTGTIDTLGIVHLNWIHNSEQDLLGYRVYISNNPNHEFSIVTPSTLVENKFVDTLSLKNSNRKIYYKINALDQRANPSNFSEILELEKPDMLPPGQAIFKQVKQVSNSQMTIEWLSSPSADTQNYLIYRKEDNIKEWKLIFTGTKEDRNFQDNTIEPGKLYSYTILAKDTAGLESPPVSPVSVLTKYIGARPEVKGFNATANIEQQSIVLNWRYREKDVTQFEVYKRAESAPLKLFKTLPGSTSILKDTDLTINTNYTYAIRAVFKDGGLSKKTELTIKF